MNANVLAQAATESDAQPNPAPTRRRGGGAKAGQAAQSPFNPAELAGTQDDDLRLERAAEAIRNACRNGRLEDASAAAAAAMPSLEQDLPRASLLHSLAQAKPAPMTPPEENRLYLLRRINGAPIGLFRLRDNGQVSASGGSALSRWSMADGCIELQQGDGHAAARFMLCGDHQGLRLYLGESQIDGTLQMLSEVRCAYSRLRMLDPELAGPFGALYDTDAMVPALLPERAMVLLATPHTGANRLLRLLNASAQGLIDGELLHPQHIGLYGGELRPDEAGSLYSMRAKDPVYFARLLMSRSHHSDGRTLNDVPLRGFTLNPAHSRPVLDWVMGERHVCVVHLVRDNLLAEFASILAGGADSPRRPRLHFEAARFQRFVVMKQRYLAMVRERLEARSGPWAEIETGAFTRQNIVDLMGLLLPGGTGLALPAAALTRQRPERTLERFDNPDEVMRNLTQMGHEDWANG